MMGSTRDSLTLYLLSIIGVSALLRYRAKHYVNRKLNLKPQMLSADVVSCIRNIRKEGEHVYVVGYPKSGNHLCVFACYLLLSDCADLDGSIHNHAHFMDRTVNWSNSMPIMPPNSSTGPRERKIFYTHLTPEIVMNNSTPETRFIYIVRDIRDVLASFFAMQAAIKLEYSGWRGTLEEYTELFCSPKQFYGSWINHIEMWLAAAEKDNRILIVRFEDLAGEESRIPTLEKINKHIKNHESELPADQIPVLKDRLSFNWMKQNSSLFQIKHASILADPEWELVNRGSVQQHGLSNASLDHIRNHLKENCTDKIIDKFIIGGRKFLD